MNKKIIPILGAGLALGGLAYFLSKKKSYPALDTISDCSEEWIGDAMIDTNMKIIGAQSLKFHCVDGSTAGSRLNISQGVFINGSVGFWLYTSDKDKIEEIKVQLYPDYTNRNYYYEYYPALNGLLTRGFPNGRWWYVPISPVLFNKSSIAANWTGQNIKDILISVKAKDFQNVDVWLGGITHEKSKKAAITLGFDGVYTSARDNALPLMDAHNWKGVLYPVASSTTRMSVTELKEYYKRGWDVIPHGWSLAFDKDTPEGVMRDDIKKAQDWAIRSGFGRGAFIGSPIGHNGTCDNPNTRGIAAEYYTASRYRWRWDDTYNYQAYKETPAKTSGWPYKLASYSWIIPDWYQIHCPGWHWYSIIEGMKKIIDRVVNCNGMLNMFTHKVMENPVPQVDISISDWKEIVNYIADYESQNKIEVITMTEYLDRTLFNKNIPEIYK